MALALNVYRTIISTATTEKVGIYTAPVGYTGIVLLAQATNTNTATQTFTLDYTRTVSGVAVTFPVASGFPIESNDSTGLVDGKLVIQSGDVLTISGSVETDIKFVASILETLN